MKPAPGVILENGNEIYLHEIVRITTVEPPKVDDKRVAFIFTFWTGHDYKIIFDFSPNWAEIVSSEEPNLWNYEEEIVTYLQAILIEKTVNVLDNVASKLLSLGLWAAPSLLPYPLSKIAKHLDEDNLNEAHATLLKHCNVEFLEQITSNWWEIDEFKVRRALIEEAIYAHRMGKYHLSIYSLMPHLEGIITDWMHSNPSTVPIKWRQESKTDQFRQILLANPSTSFAFKRLVESSTDFTLKGPLLKTFKNWQDQLDLTFPNRHVLEHGRYEEALFTQENSIKLFLLLDTYYHLVSN